jgi:crossover junction endodeoxyribonuclease RusA
VTYLLELVVDLDIGHPPTPNRRLHWAAKARSNAEWRRWTKLAALAAIRSSGMADEYPLRSVLVEPTFYFPTNRRRDEDNLLASLKPVLDGLVDAGVVDDDSRERLRLLSPIVRIAPRKAVRLRVKEAPR